MDSAPSSFDRLRQAEACAVARRHVEDLEMLLRVSARVASEVAVGGATYPAGVAELARRLGADLLDGADTVEALVARRSAGPEGVALS